MGSASNLIKVARGELKLRYREGPNNATKYGAWYGSNHQPWCDMFVSWCAWKSGNQGAVGKQAVCQAHVNWFRKKGRWGKTPRVGAIVFFAWHGVYSHHVGIVEKVNSDGSIYTIEGNTNTNGSANGIGVFRMRRRSHILGYGYPAFGSGSVPAPKPGGSAYPGAHYFGIGKTNSYVTKLGKMLIARGGRRFYKEAGSTFTEAYRKACAAFQRAQGWSGSSADGIPGPKMWSYLVHHKGHDIPSA